VLGAAVLFEGSSFMIALRQFRKTAGPTPFLVAFHRSKDPTTYTVLAKDAAALVGFAIAGIEIVLSHASTCPNWTASHRSSLGCYSQASPSCSFASRAAC